MKFGCEDFHLLDLLRWSVTSAFPQLGRKTFPMQVVWNIGRALEKLILVSLSAKGVGEISGLRLQCAVSPSARHHCFLPVPGCQKASAVTLSANTPWSPFMLMEKTEQGTLEQQLVKPQLTMKEETLHKADFVKQPMTDQATHENPLSVQKKTRDKPTDQPAKRSHPTPSVQKTGSQNHATDRPAKKRATQHLVAVRPSMPE